MEADRVLELAFGEIRSERRGIDDEMPPSFAIALIIVDQDTGMRVSVPMEGKAIVRYVVDACANFIRVSIV